jgi:hypothetical protein
MSGGELGCGREENFMRKNALRMTAVLAFAALATPGSAEQRPTDLAAVEAPIQVVELVEYAQPMPVAAAPLPQPRPVRAAAPRPRPQAASAPAQTRAPEAVARPPLQRVALETKPRSPLFWMSVGTGF